MKNRKIAVNCFMEFADGTVKPFEELTESELNECRKKITANLKKGMTEYYSHHLDEFALLPDAPE